MDIIEKLKNSIGDDKILSEQQLESRYNHIWKMDVPLQAKAVVLPTSTEEVSKTCAICYQNNQKMVVFGGLTNLVGGTETKGDEVVISMERMNTIEQVDTQNQTMTVQSGVILEEIHNKADENDLLFPLSFGAKGSCQIGGCISSNAGGIRVLRYGMTRKQILGLEAVLPDGTIISSLKKMIKNNSGYDLKQLFIGAEGTLGIVTKAVLKLEEKPVSRNSAFLAFDDFNKVVRFLKLIKKETAGQLSAFEYLESSTYENLTSEDTHWRPPVPYGFPYYILVETMGGHQEKDLETLENILEKAFEQELVCDGAIASNASQQDLFWGIREDVGILARKHPFDQHFDVSLPIKHMHHYIENVKKEITALPDVNDCFVFGHLADGNMHFVVGKTSDSIELKNKINAIVYQPLKELEGSISAEHGVGIHKKNYLKHCRTENEIGLMKLLKNSFDSKNLLNSNRIFD